MRSLISAGVSYRPPQFSVAGIGPNGVVSVFHQGDIGMRASGQGTEDDAIRGVLLDWDAQPLSSAPAIQFNQRPFRCENHFVSTIAIQVLNLAGDIVMQFLAPDLGITPPPQDRTIQLLYRHGTGVMHVALIDVLRRQDLGRAISVQIPRNKPHPGIVLVERDRLPGFCHGDRLARSVRISRVETSEFRLGGETGQTPHGEKDQHSEEALISHSGIQGLRVLVEVNELNYGRVP